MTNYQSNRVRTTGSALGDLPGWPPACSVLSMMIRLLAALLLTFVVAACGKSFTPRNLDRETKDFTGATNPKGVPYTGAADSAELELLKQSIDPTPKENLDLAASIKSVTIDRQDLAGNAVTAAPAKLDIRISLGAAPIAFAPVLNSSHDASAVTSTGSDLKLNVHCLDADCVAVEVRLTKGTAEGGFIYRTRPVTVEFLGPFEAAGASTSKLDHIGQSLGTDKSQTMVTVEVAWGPAMFNLKAGDVVAVGDLVATGGQEENISIQAKDEKALDGRLLGNSNHGDLLLRVADGTAWAFMRVRLPTPPTGAGSQVPADEDDGDATTTPVLPDDTPVNDRYIPYDPSNAITARFQRDKTNPIVQEEIKNMSVGKRSGDMKMFLSRARPNLDVMVRALATQQIPPELLFVTFVESRYFYSNYDISVSSAKAVGPWQFMPDTGRGLGLKVFDVTPVKTRLVNGKQMYRYTANSCDERADLEKSSIAAAKYLRDLLNTFKHDPKLAIMAYNMGGGGLKKRLATASQQMNQKENVCAESRLCAYDMAKIGYWELRRLNIGPQESRDYVIRFLAAQFVGRAPGKMGVTYDTSFVTPAPKLPVTCAQ
jgi:hypothetical protein